MRAARAESELSDPIGGSAETESLVFTALALSAAAFHPWAGGGFWFFLIPLFWILLIVALFAIFGRRWRHHGPHGYGYGPHAWHAAQAAGSAESVLAQRYANGDIDEKEYRARLEVLRSSGPVPPQK
jgi:putative membrane protein